jgi:hypothetical protein
LHGGECQQFIVDKAYTNYVTLHPSLHTILLLAFTVYGDVEVPTLQISDLITFFSAEEENNQNNIVRFKT